MVVERDCPAVPLHVDGRRRDRLTGTVATVAAGSMPSGHRVRFALVVINFVCL